MTITKDARAATATVSVDPARHASRLGRRIGPRTLIGPLITVAAIGAILLVRGFFPISSPGLVLLLTIALSAVIGGILPALVSTALTWVFVAVDASIPGQLFSYTPEQYSRLVLNVLVAPAMAVLIGFVQARLEREEVLATRQRAEDRERALTETATDGVIAIDPASVIRTANPAAHALFGYPAGELIGRPLTDLMPEGVRDSHRKALGRYLRTGRRTMPWTGTELMARHSSGREFPVEVSFGAYGTDDGRRFTGIVRDIRRRRELEEQLRQAQKMEAVGQLAGGVAHDFNNVLTAVVGFGNLLKAELPPGDHRRDFADNIVEAASRATDLVGQLLAFARRQVLRPEIVDPNEVVAGVEPMLRRLIGEHIAMTTRLGANLAAVEVDRGQLHQVIINLAVNARDAMPRGGNLVIETTNVELGPEYAADHADVTPGPHVMLSISDTGVGMDAATRDRIFEPFFTTKAQGEGTGLGLATVYGIVRQSGGHVWVYSEPGHGSTFRVYLPAVARAADAARPPAPSAPRGAGELVLVAEDDDAVRELARLALEGLGYRVLLASSPAEAATIADGRGIRLLVTDVVMPGSSGLDLAVSLRATDPGLPVVFMSGYAAGIIERHGPLSDLDRYLQKPFTADELGRVVADLLGATPARVGEIG